MSSLYVHGDVTPCRVLVNGNFCGCLTDSGLARFTLEGNKLDHSLERSKPDVTDMEIGTLESVVVTQSKCFKVVFKERKETKLPDEQVMASLRDQSLPSS